jgi:hypothetical protein
MPKAVQRVEVVAAGSSAAYDGNEYDDDGESNDEEDEAGGASPSGGWCRDIAVHFHPQFTPLDGGRTRHVGNLLEDDLLRSLLYLKQAAPLRRGQGQEGGRKPRRTRDPRMSFRDF